MKTGFAAALILPQSILLGMTFPLMTVGLMRRLNETSGATIAMLYFVNSLGAAVGVLVSGFTLLSQFGLDGTVRVAGGMNLTIAGILWLVLRRLPPPQALTKSPDSATSRAAPRLILGVALFTGAASFIYEIVWIRMLNMVLGSSTHSFELMLSAFILGLALGSFWIRKHISAIKHPLAVLGFIQIAMATLALATLMFNDFSFALMSVAFYTFAKTPLGYFAFMFASHGIALLIMLPVTICAGMTLPLATRVCWMKDMASVASVMYTPAYDRRDRGRGRRGAFPDPDVLLGDSVDRRRVSRFRRWVDIVAALHAIDRSTGAARGAGLEFRLHCIYRVVRRDRPAKNGLGRLSNRGR